MALDLHNQLELSHKLGDDIAHLLADATQPNDRRGMLTTTMCRLAIDHGNGQRLLVLTGHVTTALALVRVQYEAMIRAVWMLHGASDEWLTRFLTPKASGDQSETVIGPAIDSMLNTLDTKVPAPYAKMLRELKTATWGPMNSFVHGGIHAVVNTLVEAEPKRLVSLLRNANGMSLMSAQTFMQACRDSKVAGRIGKIRAMYTDALPTTNTSVTTRPS